MLQMKRLISLGYLQQVKNKVKCCLIIQGVNWDKQMLSDLMV